LANAAEASEVELADGFTASKAVTRNRVSTVKTSVFMDFLSLRKLEISLFPG
jgi:hypothetical protein